jgi:hypothetical protein
MIAAVLAGCSNGKSPTATLYHNAPFGLDGPDNMRVHFATFDADRRNTLDSDPDYNMKNCKEVARRLNADVAASIRAAGGNQEQLFGYWCEAGSYRETGAIPASFLPSPATR